ASAASCIAWARGSSSWSRFFSSTKAARRAERGPRPGSLASNWIRRSISEPEAISAKPPRDPLPSRKPMVCARRGWRIRTSLLAFAFGDVRIRHVTHRYDFGAGEAVQHGAHHRRLHHAFDPGGFGILFLLGQGGGAAFIGDGDAPAYTG